MSINPLKVLSDMDDKFRALENMVHVLSQRIEELEKSEKIHMLRLKNHEQVSDDFVLSSCHYNDLSPEKAFEFYNNKDRNFILLDVTNEEFSPMADFPEVTHIPLEILDEKLNEITNKSVSILVISEEGVRSIIACEILYQYGYLNLNNISGGYRYWPGFNNLVNLKPAKVLSA
jgi:rhodanese-related sulfurtransferase